MATCSRTSSAARVRRPQRQPSWRRWTSRARRCTRSRPASPTGITRVSPPTTVATGCSTWPAATSSPRRMRPPPPSSRRPDSSPQTGRAAGPRYFAYGVAETATWFAENLGRRLLGPAQHGTGDHGLAERDAAVVGGDTAVPVHTGPPPLQTPPHPFQQEGGLERAPQER